MPTLLDKPWFNAIWFNVFWLIAVNGQNSLLVILFLLLVIHLSFVSNKLNEYLTILSISILGCGIDLILSLNNFYVFKEGQILPFWLVFLWLAFSTTLSRCFKFLTITTPQRYLISSLIGGIGGAFSYLTASKLGAVEFTLAWQQSFLLLIIIWALLFPSLIFIKDKCALLTFNKAAI